MFAIKWKRENHPLLPDISGLVLNNDDVNNLNKVITFGNYVDAEQKIIELKKTASSSISFEVVDYED